MKNKRMAIWILIGALLLSILWVGAAWKVFTDYAGSIERHEFIYPAVEREGTVPVETLKEECFLTPDDIELETYYDSLEYLAQAVEAEAGNQGYKGKRLVARVIINRMTSGQFPDDFYSVINQENQFEVVSNGKIYCVPSDETIRVVQDELAECSDSRILFFTAGGFNLSGTPLYQYGDHYFSGR